MAAKRGRGKRKQAASAPRAPTRLPRWALLAAVALAVLVGVLALREPAEPQLEAELRELAAVISAPPGDTAAQRRSRIERAVQQHLAPSARLQIAELPDVTTPGPAFVDALVGIVEPGEEAQVEIVQADTEVAADRASVQLDARLAGDVGRDLHAPHRQVTLGLIRTASGWQIVHVDVPARTQAEPEPRP